MKSLCLIDSGLNCSCMLQPYIYNNYTKILQSLQLVNDFFLSAYYTLLIFRTLCRLSHLIHHEAMAKVIHVLQMRKQA